MDAAVSPTAAFSTLQFLLNQLKHLRLDDGFVVALHIVLRDLALVLFCFLLEEVHRELLLQERIAFVLFISKDAADGALAPDCLAARSRQFPLRQLLCDGVAGQAIQK